MSSELPVSADALLAERARLELELQSSEDWCELLRLKSRKDRGEAMSAVNAARLEMVLIDALAEDPAFVRYKAVCVALERMIRGLPPIATPSRAAKPAVEPDDLTKIRGITASMERRLKALDVTTFAQIADWGNADIQDISADLGIGKQIYAQNWIEQAAVLAKPTPRAQEPKVVAPVAQPIAPPILPRATAPAPQQPVASPAAKPGEPDEKSSAEPSQVTAVKPLVRDQSSPPKDAKPQSQPPTVVPTKNAPEAVEPIVPPVEIAPAAAVVVKPTPAPAPVVEQAPLKPSLPPPNPLLPSRYGKAPPDAPRTPTNDEAVKPRPLPNPPLPLRVAVVPTNDASARDMKQVLPPLPARPTLPSAASQSSTLATAAALPTPPRPLVITRGSLPKLTSTSAANSKPVTSTAPQAPPSLPPPTRAAATPSMSISEAIAYAAEVARKGERPVATAASTAPAPAAVAPAARPASPSPPVQASKPASVALPPVAPPPLPPGFAPVEPIAAVTASAKVQNSRFVDPDEHAAYRLNIEEATVEIVQKSPPNGAATPRMTLTKSLPDATVAGSARAATPIGRFLKALTGNS